MPENCNSKGRLKLAKRRCFVNPPPGASRGRAGSGVQGRRKGKKRGERKVAREETIENNGRELKVSG